MTIRERVFRCVGPCWTGDCNCRELDGIRGPTAPMPPIHEGCVCVLEMIGERGGRFEIMGEPNGTERLDRMDRLVREMGNSVDAMTEAAAGVIHHLIASIGELTTERDRAEAESQDRRATMVELARKTADQSSLIDRLKLENDRVGAALARADTEIERLKGRS